MTLDPPLVGCQCRGLLCRTPLGKIEVAEVGDGQVGLSLVSFHPWVFPVSNITEEGLGPGSGLLHCPGRTKRTDGEPNLFPGYAGFKEECLGGFLAPDTEAPVGLIQPIGTYAAFAMVAGLAGLWARRFLVDRVRYISSPSDHLMLALLLGIGMTGIGMRFFVPTDIVAVKAFFLGVMYFDWQPLPADALLVVHLFLVAILMIIFPFSKLLHAPGVFFSPTRNQVDNPREKRHVSVSLDKIRAGNSASRH